MALIPHGPLAAPQGSPVNRRMLDPAERTSEVLFGLIMVLTFTGSLSIAEAGREDIRAMLIGAPGCNIAWGPHGRRLRSRRLRRLEGERELHVTIVGAFADPGKAVRAGLRGLQLLRAADRMEASTRGELAADPAYGVLTAAVELRHRRIGISARPERGDLELRLALVAWAGVSGWARQVQFAA